jgi:glutathione peroxidase-family protein
MSSIQSIPVKTIKGEDTSLAAFDGNVLLVVNVASQCGLTPQYEALESVYENSQCSDSQRTISAHKSPALILKLSSSAQQSFQ